MCSPMAARSSLPLCFAIALLASVACGRIGFGELPRSDVGKSVPDEDRTDADNASDANVELTDADRASDGDGSAAPADADSIDADVLPDAGRPSADASSVESGATPATDAAAHDASPRASDAGPADAGTSESGVVTADMCPTVASAAGTHTLIDDLEDGDSAILELDGRHGSWYTINDGTGGTQQPAPAQTFAPARGGALGSDYSAHMTGTDFSSWGAALGVRFDVVGANTCAYDASRYQGIAFYARGSGMVTISIITASTVPVASGGTCETGCFDYYAGHVSLSSTWTRYQLAWSDLRQTGWGTPTTFDPGEIMATEWAFGTGVSFEIDVDDLQFF